MKTRLDMKNTEPEAYQAMMGFEKYLSKTSISKAHKNLLKIRASQLNGCAYCVDMHSYEALEAGESQQKLFLVSCWRETDLFNEEEKAVLALTEEVTLISNRLSDETYEHAVGLLGEKYVAQLMMAIITINAWNRIGVATEMKPAERVLA
jgi:AhpD family alkylhydroperoxidase